MGTPDPDRILLVDDDEDLRTLVGYNLERAGFAVTPAKDGLEALELLAGGTFDLVVSDVMMPRMHGFELCRRVREQPELDDIPFLFLTGKGDPDDQYRGLMGGADDYLAKPFDVAALLARVRGHLARRKRRPSSGLSLPPAEPRWCPSCGHRTPATLCPRDGVATVPLPSPEAPAVELEAGAVVADRFRLVRLVGKGAMGQVFVADQLSINRRVALKLLQPRFLSSENDLARFYREASVASQINHPHVVPVLDFGVDEVNRVPFIALGLVEGVTLRQLLANAGGSFDLDRGLRIALQMLGALEAAHAQGVVHRDLKPDNVMARVLPDGQLSTVILDFGVAKRLGGEGPSVSRVGELVGTPYWMSPEQVESRDVGPPSDLYGFGCLLYQMLSGKTPFEEEHSVRVMIAHVKTPAPTLDRLPDGTPVPPLLTELLLGLLAKSPEARPTATQAAATLRGLLSDPFEPPRLSVGEDLPVASSVPLEAERTLPSDPHADTHVRAEVKLDLGES